MARTCAPTVPQAVEDLPLIFVWLVLSHSGVKLQNHFLSKEMPPLSCLPVSTVTLLFSSVRLSLPIIFVY